MKIGSGLKGEGAGRCFKRTSTITNSWGDENIPPDLEKLRTQRYTGRERERCLCFQVPSGVVGAVYSPSFPPQCQQLLRSAALPRA